MNVLVVPTNRPAHLRRFLAAWAPWPWDKILVVEDGPEVSFAPFALHGSRHDAARIDAYSWKEIDGSVPEAWIFSRRDAAIRSFGFWKAWELGADHIFTLDDDCFPVTPGDGHAATEFLDRHLENFTSTPTWQSTVPGLRVRGLPYMNMGALENVCLSVGLWVGNPDLDAIQMLAQPSTLSASDLAERGLTSRVMPSDQYFPMSGMNLAFRREVASLMYFPPMGVGSPYGRFDDIWCGLLLQRICRHLRLAITCGAPLVHHVRASDAFTNLVKEAPGIVVNEYMWEIVDAIEFHGQDPLTCMREAGAALEGYDGREDYVRRWGVAIGYWCSLFETVTEASPAVPSSGISRSAPPG